MAVSPNSPHLALGSGTYIEIWCTKRWQCIQTLDIHHGEVNSVTFSPNIKFLASGGSNPGSVEGSIQIWDVETGSPYKSLGVTAAVSSQLSSQMMA